MAIRTAILGYGRSGSTMHAGPIEATDAFEMAAVCDIDPERLKQASERFGCPVYDDYNEMLRKEKLDLVCVITRSDQHCRMTCDCLDAGASVLVTKPWAVNAAEGEEMIDHAKRSKGKLLPWLPARWGPDLRRLKTIIAEGVIGKPFLVRRIVRSFGTRTDWQTERRFGGGYLLNWGPHIVDPPCVLIGSRVASVYARMKQTINPGDVEDLFFALMTLRDGTLVQAEFTVATEPLPSWFIQGDRGTIVVHHDRRLVVHAAAPPRPADPTQYSSMQTDAEITYEETTEGCAQGDQFEIYRHIADAMQGKTRYGVKPQDALQLSRVFDAIRASNDKNQVVRMR